MQAFDITPDQRPSFTPMYLKINGEFADPLSLALADYRAFQAELSDDDLVEDDVEITDITETEQGLGLMLVLSPITTQQKDVRFRLLNDAGRAFVLDRWTDIVVDHSLALKLRDLIRTTNIHPYDVVHILQSQKEMDPRLAVATVFCAVSTTNEGEST